MGYCRVAAALRVKDGAQDIDVRRRALDDPDPNGCVCRAVRAVNLNVTALPTPRANVFARNNGSIRTVPVNHSAGPIADGRDPLRLIFIELSPRFWMVHHAAFERRLILDRAVWTSGRRNEVRGCGSRHITSTPRSRRIRHTVTTAETEGIEWRTAVIGHVRSLAFDRRHRRRELERQLPLRARATREHGERRRTFGDPFFHESRLRDISPLQLAGYKSVEHMEAPRRRVDSVEGDPRCRRSKRRFSECGPDRNCSQFI